MVYPNIHILYIVATQGVDKNPRGMLNCPQSIQRGEDMYINYISREVTRVVTEDVVEGFCVSLTIPVQVVRNIVERHFGHYGDYGMSGFYKINAIKEVRMLTHAIQTVGKDYSTTTVAALGLREAKEMVEAVYREGEEDRRYHTSQPYPSSSEQTDNHVSSSTDSDKSMADTLPF